MISVYLNFITIREVICTEYITGMQDVKIRVYEYLLPVSYSF